MPAAKLSGLVHRLGGSPDDASADGELLRRFVAARDEDAFGELVRRYAPLVFAACRRVTGDHHLAEDAFQAVFVVLAAKAREVRADALPAFLHAVATRTALRARTMSDRRRQREQPVGTPPDAESPTPDAAEAADLAQVVDEEVAGLPEGLRSAVVLCELEGHSRKDAAARLGVPEGTVSSRLASARKRLAERLRVRGVALGAAALSLALGARATARVPADLTARAVS
ncbi:MAG: sigma-70 family RNA polymerase sigma factor, partial [Gemmataceae bacterium]|nr:sigma-70 family RNA polymerase sigma factor [Gemmataceae bacterium]